jgi:predicted DNA-binding transcriptional regulator YafY
MLSILWMLRSGKRMTAKQLAEELEIHVRTVYRCIDSLCASGVPIVADLGPNGGYSILSRFADSPLFFDAEGFYKLKSHYKTDKKRQRL